MAPKTAGAMNVNTTTTRNLRIKTGGGVNQLGLQKPDRKTPSEAALRS
jgi:hypothetical protein